VHGAFSIILVSPRKAEKRQEFVPGRPGNAPVHARDGSSANGLERLNDASELLHVNTSCGHRGDEFTGQNRQLPSFCVKLRQADRLALLLHRLVAR
jgi:hypothetical protein